MTIAKLSPERRTTLDIISEILLVSKECCNKSAIMRIANMSYDRMQVYIPFLIEKELLSFSVNGYCTTPKGRQFVANYLAIKEMLK